MIYGCRLFNVIVYNNDNENDNINDDDNDNDNLCENFFRRGKVFLFYRN